MVSYSPLFRPRASTDNRVMISCAIILTMVVVCSPTVQASHETPAQGEDVSGEYILIRAAGKDLPAVVSESRSGRQEVTGGSILLEANGAYTWRTEYRYTADGRVETSESFGRGRYSRQGTAIIFSFEGDDVRLPGTLDGDTITLQADVEMVYQKRPGN